MPRSPLARSSALLLALAAGLPLAMVGCSGAGHGKYTSEHLSLAQTRMNEMKAAQEWDMARQAFLAGDLNKALAAVDRSLALNDKVVKSHVLRGRVLMEKGDLEGALIALGKAEELDPASVDAQYYQGLVFERFTQREQALEHFAKAAELDPGAPLYAIATVEMMMDLGRLDEAEAYLLNRRASFEHNAGIRQTLGHIAMIKGEHAKAVELFNEARLLAPDDGAILEDLVRAQIATGRFAEAEYNIERLLQTPENTGRRDLRQLRARCLLAVDRPVEARDLLIALTNEPEGAKDVNAWIALGDVAYILRDNNRLRLASSRLIGLSPDRHEGHTFRALLLRRQGELRAALHSADRAAQLAGPDANPHLLRGLILQDLGRTAEAKASFATALKLDPSSVSTDLLAQLATPTQKQTQTPAQTFVNVQE